MVCVKLPLSTRGYQHENQTLERSITEDGKQPTNGTVKWTTSGHFTTHGQHAVGEEDHMWGMK